MKNVFAFDLTESSLSDFSHPGFRRAFECYFSEMEISVDDWEAVYREMAVSGAQALLLRSPDGETEAFLLYAVLPFSSSFFEGSAAFIQEFWVAPPLRGQGLGRRLLRSAETLAAAVHGGRAGGKIRRFAPGHRAGRGAFARGRDGHPFHPPRLCGGAKRRACAHI